MSIPQNHVISSGIGRALAVELARYRIPLILVARDVTKLTKVAHDIEKYYNVPCRVLQADLSTPDCASRIHAATTEAGLKVDILINNAGVCDQGEMIEGDTDDIMNMIQVNVGSVVQLSQLYGRDMKERRVRVYVYIPLICLLFDLLTTRIYVSSSTERKNVVCLFHGRCYAGMCIRRSLCSYQSI